MKNLKMLNILMSIVIGICGLQASPEVGKDQTSVENVTIVDATQDLKTKILTIYDKSVEAGLDHTLPSQVRIVAHKVLSNKSVAESDYTQAIKAFDEFASKMVSLYQGNLPSFTSGETLLYNTNFGTTGVTISAPGIYRLAENIVFSPSSMTNAVTITASNVVLDFQNFSITQNNTIPSVNGVVIGGSNVQNVTVMGGLVANMTGIGLASNQINNLTVQNMSFVSCGYAGIQVSGAARGLLVDNCNINACCTAGNNDIIDDHLAECIVDTVSVGTISNCRIYNNQIPQSETAIVNLYGFNLSNCSMVEVINCASYQNVCTTYNAFNLTSCVDCSLSNCVSEEDNGAFGGTPTSFNIVSSSGISVLDCRSQGNTSGQHPFGIRLAGTNNSLVQRCAIINNNNTDSNDYQGLSLSNASFNTIQDCTVTGNVSGLNLNTIELVSSSNMNIIDGCLASMNRAPNGICNGFLIDSSSNNMVQDCNISQNLGDNDDDSFGINNNGTGNLFVNIKAYNNGANTDNQLSGVPSASQVALTAGAMNIATGPFANAAIVP